MMDDKGMPIERFVFEVDLGEEDVITYDPMDLQKEFCSFLLKVSMAEAYQLPLPEALFGRVNLGAHGGDERTHARRRALAEDGPAQRGSGHSATEVRTVDEAQDATLHRDLCPMGCC
ncbi:uncharacterized protein ACA1_066550 [Acanthamoeba castellanii str. Neff]|uniref:Uncharacterized protein n=1 Tax=Acanthamoeba castellanii (strain ATCC 30010 / Neff) TaxID=1257118 RepID=L8GNS9_ACACF|nr:uncharacterized protein ACA1_066550 [Acanthamoeba castellanii str. Neff]ELR14624.1 hypothetical protein ACA1_066550 [Acanthamoeba castellanii str. Neff]